MNAPEGGGAKWLPSKSTFKKSRSGLTQAADSESGASLVFQAIRRRDPKGIGDALGRSLGSREGGLQVVERAGRKEERLLV